MTASLFAAAVLAVAAQPSADWVWSFYDGDGAPVLVREVPDTDRLSALLECRPGTGLVRLTVYGARRRPDFINVSAGDVSADIERMDSDDLSVQLRLDHPVFDALARGEGLAVAAGDETIRAPAPRRATLAQFRTACTGG